MTHCPNCKTTISPPTAEKCAACGHTLLSAETLSARPGFMSLPPMRYQNAYVWLVLASALDIMLTWIVIFRMDGAEVNPVAAAVIREDGSGWNLAIAYKFGLIVMAIMMCEFVGRLRESTGRKLSLWSVVIGAFPAVYTLALLFFHIRGDG